MTSPAEASPLTTPASIGSTTLVIDIGGTGLKASVLDARGVMLTHRVRIPTTYPCPPDELVAQLGQLVDPLPTFDRVSVGFPGVVRGGVILSAPHFITAHGPGTRIDKQLKTAWNRFDLASALSQSLDRPVRIVNDADLQGLDAITGRGVEVAITLGTGLGLSVFDNGHPGPHLELAHHRFRKGETYDEQVGNDARKRIGKRRWNKRILRLIKNLDALAFYDHLYIGGGNARHVTCKLGPNITIIDANAAILGGIKLWEQSSQ